MSCPATTPATPAATGSMFTASAGMSIGGPPRIEEVLEVERAALRLRVAGTASMLAAAGPLHVRPVPAGRVSDTRCCMVHLGEVG